MLYRKNIGNTERALRGLGGAGVITAGALAYGASPLGWLLIASGATLIATAWIGFCPACALAGRRSVE